MSTIHRQAVLTEEQAVAQHGEFWNLSILNRKDGRHICFCCNDPASGRSSMNIWWTVVDFETCAICHPLVDGKRADSIPHPSEVEVSL